ncbi:MAG: hypothetical protein IH886_09155 [Nitrospinae bacterium]|nr:hypothetical protein [Nitrospinota bacterium]
MKEIVSHLRLVHFSLLVTCLGLMITIFQDPSFDLDRAYKDIQAIANVEKELKEEDICKYLSRRGFEIKENKFKYGKGLSFELTDQKNNKWLLEARMEPWYLDETLEKVRTALTENRKEWRFRDCRLKEFKLSLFKKFWNILDAPQRIAHSLKVDYNTINSKNMGIKITKPETMRAIHAWKIRDQSIKNAQGQFREIVKLKALRLQEVRFFSDGKTVAVTGKNWKDDYTVWVVDIESGKIIKELPRFDLFIRIDTHPGKPILLAADSQRMDLWDKRNTNSEISLVENQKININDTNISPIKNLSVSLSDNAKKIKLIQMDNLWIFNISTGESFKSAIKGLIPSGMFSHFGNKYLWQTENKVRVFDTDGSQKAPVDYDFSLQKNSILRSVNFTSDEQSLIGFSFDRNTKINAIHRLNLEDKRLDLLKEVQRFEAGFAKEILFSINPLKLSVGENWLAIWNRYGKLAVFNMANKLFTEQIGNFKSLNDVQWSPKGDLLLAVGIGKNELYEKAVRAELYLRGKNFTFRAKSDNYEFDFTTSAEFHDLDLRNEITQWGNPERTWDKEEPFEEAFKSLDQVTQGIQDLKIKDIHDVLENRKRQGTGQFEIVGLKIPVNFLAVFGIWPIALIQLYFLLHFNSFKDIYKQDSGYENHPWIGVYPDFWPRLVFGLTVVALPVISATLIERKSFTFRPDAFWEMVSAYALSLILSAITMIQIQRFWKQTPEDVVPYPSSW